MLSYYYFICVIHIICFLEGIFGFSLSFQKKTGWEPISNRFSKIYRSTEYDSSIMAT